MSITRAIRLKPTTFVAITLALVFVLFVRSYLLLELRKHGYDTAYAKDLSYLVVPPLLVLMLFPVLGQHKEFISWLLRRHRLTLRLVVSAIALGVLMRVVWWSQLIARVSFGLTTNHNPDALVGPVFHFACPPPQVIGLGFLVMALLVPVMEEVVHRGLIQSALAHKGRVVAVLLSALVFAVFHTPSSYVFVFVMGIVLGVQFWNTQTLWPSVITHATYNGLIQIDWRCLHASWNPRQDELPLLWPGTVALCLLIISLIAAVSLLSTSDAGVHDTPRP